MTLVKGLFSPPGYKASIQDETAMKHPFKKEKESLIETHTSAYHAPYYTSPRRHIILGN